MFKILFIAGLVALLVFFIVRRLGFWSSNVSATYLPTSDWIELVMDNQSLKRTVKQTLFSVFVGFVLLIIVLVIAAKFRIALIMLPISFYLIGQYFMLMNQIKSLRQQQVFYNCRTHEVKVNTGDDKSIVFGLDTGLIRVQEIRAVQKNNGVLFGYYRLLSTPYKVVIPFILRENSYNKAFFDKLDMLPKEIENKLFPII